MSARVVLLASTLATVVACSSSPSSSVTPVLPTIIGWERLQSEVIVGDYAKFRLMLDWGGPMPAGLEWHTSYDLIAAHVGGLPINPVLDPVVTREGESGELIELPTKNTGYVFIEAAGFLDVCQDREYGECVRGYPTRTYSLAGGGKANTVDFLRSTMTMVIGERRPMQGTPMAGGERPLTVQASHEVVASYVSENPSVLTVDANGVIEAHAIGSTRVQAFSESGTLGWVDVDVVDGVPGPLQGSALVTDRPTEVPIGSSYLASRTPDTFAMQPNGYPAFLVDADVSSALHDGFDSSLFLARWTGSGLGYERIGAWWETTRAHFFDIATDGHQFAGWLAYRGTGVVILDRPGTVEVGGWQRRRLPMRLDLTTGAEREDGPHWPNDFGVQNEKEKVSTLISNHVIIGTFGAPDGLWIAYGWGANYATVPGKLPRWAESTCVQIIRLAHVTAAAITVEDLTMRFYRSEGCEDLVNGFNGGEAFFRIAVGPPEDGSDRPTLLVDTQLNPVGGVRRKWQHGAGGWVATYRGGALDSGDTVSLPFEWDIDAPLSTQLLAGGLCFGTIGPGGAVWGGCPGFSLGRTGPYGNRASDSVIGPSYGMLAFSGVDVEYMTGGGGYGHIASVVRAAPPWAAAGSQDTWLYQQPLIPAPRPTDSDVSGTRLSSVAVTPRYSALIVLANSTRVLMQRPHQLMSGLSVSQSSGPGQPFSTETAVTGASVSTIDSWIAWGDGNRVLLAQGSAPVMLSVSTDHGASFSPISTTVPAAGPALRAISTSPGVTWLLTTTTISNDRLWRLDDSGGTMTVTEYTAGSWPGMGDTTESGLFVAGGVVWVITWATEITTSNRYLITRRYSPSGTALSANAGRQDERPILALAAVAGSGLVIVPTTTTLNEIRTMLRSTNAGAAWTVATPLPAIIGALAFPPLVPLPDGRVAVVLPVRTRSDPNMQPWNGDGQQAALLTTSDGITWSEPRLVRGQGGRLQRAWLTAVDGSGDLLVHLGDAGTMAGYTFGDCADAVGLVATQLANTTCLEGLLVRVAAP